MTATRAGRLRRVEHCMGTVFSLDVRDPDVDPAAADEAIGWLHRVDALFSTYRPDSDISRLRRGEITLADCAPQVRTVLERCAQLHEATDGYFDIHATGQLDPSGYVKGWAIERASDLLQAAGSANHCINGGGDVQCLGVPEPGRYWQVGVADPRDRSRIVATVSGSPLAVATSGTAERARHIIDPHTTQAPNAFASITVIGRQLAETDAHATAAFAMGDRAPDWLRERRRQALLVRTDGTTIRIADTQLRRR
ncbi:MAG TPA: FAD:protein FMN transferase [Jatrophihabitans sp.]|nr:FAD:protein FMN transferase [Jatrophihabitans sp.]